MFYGKGEIGSLTYFLLDYFLPTIEIIAWVVTKKEDGEDEFLGIPVIQIDEIVDKSCPLIIQSEKYTAEMVESAHRYGIEQVKFLQHFYDIIYG